MEAKCQWQQKHVRFHPINHVEISQTNENKGAEGHCRRLQIVKLKKSVSD